MLYPEFIYNCAKAASDYGDLAFTYSNFIMRKMESDQDYSGYLDKVYLNANAFFQRALSLGKVKAKTAVFGNITDNTVIALPDDCGKPMSAFQYCDGGHVNIPFRKVGNNVVLLKKPSPYSNVYIQCRRKIPPLWAKDIIWVEPLNDADANEVYLVNGNIHDSFVEAMNNAQSRQIDLEDYGMDDDLLQIGIDWVKGRSRDEDSKGHSEELEAESRLNDIEGDEYQFLQTKTGKVRL